MDPTERIFRQIEGKPIDRIPTFSASLDDWPVQQVLGKPLIPAKTIFMNPVSRFITDRWGKHLKKILADPFIAGGLKKGSRRPSRSALTRTGSATRPRSWSGTPRPWPRRSAAIWTG